MRGVSGVRGPSAPLIGQNAFYEVSSFYPGTVVTNNNSIKWKVFRKSGNSWVELRGTLKTGRRVSFSFPQKWYGQQLLIEAFINNPEKKAPPGILIRPSAGPKNIKSIELKDAAGHAFTQPPKYGQTITARITTENMLGDTLQLSLWERDTLTSEGHDPNNNTRLWSGSAKVTNSNGVVNARIMLSPGMMTLANKSMFEGGTHEYYMLVQAPNTRSKYSAETEVKNEQIVLSPGNSRPAPNRPAANRPAPAKPNTGPSWTERASNAASELYQQVSVKIRNILGMDPVPSSGSSNASVDQNGNGPQGECVCRKHLLVWGNKVNCDFRRKVLQISQELWPDNYENMANGLMAVMNVETAGTFKAHQIMGKSLQDVDTITADDFYIDKDDTSKGSRAVGLIQFTQAALQAIGEFKSGSGFAALHAVKLRFATMGEVRQLDYVKKYFEPSKNQIKTPEDIYLHVFAPLGVGKADDFVLYEKGTNYYSQNKTVDTENNSDGKIQRSEILGRYNRSIAAGQKSKTSQFTCSASRANVKEVKDIVTFKVYSDGRIEKHIPKVIKEGYETKYKYVYYDAKNTEHDIAVVDWTEAQNWIRGAKKSGGAGWVKVGDRYYQRGTGKNQLIKVPLPLNYESGDLKIKMGDNTTREYMNPLAFASIIGALAECSYTDIKLNGFTSSDGTGSPSVSHVNGVAGDFRYLRKDKSGGNLLINNDPDALDVDRQKKLIDAFMKFGYASFLSYRITLNGKSYILPHCTHLKDHHHHLHLNKQAYNPNYSEIKE